LLKMVGGKLVSVRKNKTSEILLKVFNNSKNLNWSDYLKKRLN